MIIGLNGLIGSGKGAASDYLQQKHNFKHLSFADSLKHAVSAIFGWDFELLKGATAESRAWREVVDPWWSERLHIKGLTPRWILQQWGTEVGRHSFHPDIWLASLERKLMDATGNVVIDDCRFPNEIESVRKQNGILIRINRGEKPEWYNTALVDLAYTAEYRNSDRFVSLMESKYPNVHISEWGWVNQKFDYELSNDGTLDELYSKLDKIIEDEAAE